MNNDYHDALPVSGGPYQNMLAELAQRELARRYYSEYLAYSYGDSWIRTRLSF